MSTDQSTDKLETQREFNYREKVELTISAAASLKDAMEVIQHSYQEKHPEVELTFNFGGSGSLQQQISNGAPVDLFLSADKVEVYTIGCRKESFQKLREQICLEINSY